MKLAEHVAVKRRWEEAGYIVRLDPRDSGVLRAFIPAALNPTVALVGMVVIRDGRMTYAEHAGRVFRFMLGDSYRVTIDNLYRHIGENPAS